MITFTMRAHAAISDFLTQKLRDQEPLDSRTSVAVPQVVYTEAPEGSSGNLLAADAVEHNLQLKNAEKMQSILEQFNDYKMMYLRTVQSAINEPVTIPEAVNSKIDVLNSKLHEVELETASAMNFGVACDDIRQSLLRCYEDNKSDILLCNNYAMEFDKCVRQF